MTGRFAPTPSGRMHIGNITAMLAAWLDSRARGQHMLLRIEDIDTPRVLPDADRWIMDDLDWLGLDWDGEPVYQSQRLDLYEQTFQALADQTIAINDGPQPVPSTYADSPTYVVPAVSRETNEPDSLPPHSRKTGIGWADPQGITQGVTQGFTQSGTRDNVPDATRAASSMPLIYPCFCSRADIRAASAPQEGDGFQIYPNTCRRLMRDHPDEVRARLARGERHSWRIAMPDAAVTFDDAVFGPQSFDLASDIGDSVIRRSDGLFGYQFVVTVDDLMMGVDSIVRGRDLLRSTALQAIIRERLLASTLRAPSGALHDPATTLRAPSDEGAVGRRPTGGETTPAYETAPAHPAYTHIPLIDNAAGRRLAKRERSLDMGALRARGVTAEQVTGVCAWLLHLLDTPEPCTPIDLLADFRAHGWNSLRADRADRRLDPADPALPHWLAAALH